ncbi:MAG: insulinase family protein [Candidatus Cloacimonadaceae bacterium]|nr:insulinase family protein [Candidatus Cloacimonadaceae bacterium]
MKKRAATHGFVLQRTRKIDEIKSTAHVYIHEKSGAELIHLACEDTNKVFCIAFKTIPEDDTGCPHILEHSVLNGSQKFPAKSTFMELIKGSLHTFINAMTASDMTLYPVASTNDKDFMNLMNVYLDAVLFPLIYKHPEILHQEGWHYEMTGETDALKIRGIVYNEMKGAFSSPDSIVMRRCQQEQFPDNAYGFESGGDPESIPELTYEKFLDFHRKYYHPSNSRIFLYGDMDIESSLKLINDDYLSKFDRDETVIEVPLQAPFKKAKKLELEYPIDEHEDPAGRCYLTLLYTFGEITNVEESAALGILAGILMQSAASPLKRAIMQSGLAKDSTATAETDLRQPSLYIVCKQVKKEDVETLTTLINNELKRLVKDGIDKKLIEAVLNMQEFFLREAQMQNFPKGLYYAWTSYALWMHGGDPLDAIGFEPLFAKLRKGLTEPYYEKLIEKALLKNKHSSVITFVPVPGLVAKQEAETRAKLDAIQEKMSKEQIRDLVEFNQQLHQWQNAEDSPTDIEKIPVLALKDINPQAQALPTELETWKEFTLLKHPVSANGIVYMKVYFDLSHAEEEDLPWLAMYSYLVNFVDSKGMDYATRSNEIYIHTGGIGMRLSLLNGYQDPAQILPKMLVSGKAVVSKVDKLTELAAEYALKPVFEDKARLATLIRELKTRMEARMMSAGISVAINRMFSPFSQIHRYSDMVGGLAYYHFLCDLEKRILIDMDAIVEELEWVRETFFTQNNLIISLTATPEDLEEASEHLAPMVESISAEAYEKAENHFITRDFNEGIYAPVKIQFCVKGGDFFRKGYSYSGKMRVLNNILSNEYLYKQIRVNGGAYGAMSNFTTSGHQYFASYRDPNLRESLDVFDTVPQYLRGFQCSQRDMDKYIIGDISNLDYPKTPESIGAAADDDYLTGFTHEDRQQIRDEVLSTKIEDIRAYADMIEAIMTKHHCCVFGNEAIVKEAAELFDVLTPVF